MSDRVSKGIFPFFELPPELRNMVYHASLVQPLVCRRIRNQLHVPIFAPVTSGASEHKGSIEGISRAPSRVELLATCRRIHAEAAGFMYHHDFFFETNITFSRFMEQIGGSKQYLFGVHVKKWDFWVNCDTVLDVGACWLASVPHLTIDCTPGYPWQPELLVFLQDPVPGFEVGRAELMGRCLQAFEDAASAAADQHTKANLRRIIEYVEAVVKDAIERQ